MLWSRRRARAALALLAGVAVGGLVPVGAAAAAVAKPAPPLPPPRAWIVVDDSTGAVLGGAAEHVPLPPASTTKLITALVALEHLPPDAAIPVSSLAASQPAMRIGMQAGQVWGLDDALHALLMVSANDAAYAIAEASGGTIAGFAAQARDALARMGMHDTLFADPAGLDDGGAYEGGTRTSAYDLAIAARNALRLTEITGIVKLVDYDFVGPDGVRHHLHSHMARFLTTYPGAIGLKPGYTVKALNSIVTAATCGGRTVVAVVLGVNGEYAVQDWAMQLTSRGCAIAPGAEAGLARLPAPVLLAAARRPAALSGRIAAPLTTEPAASRAASPRSNASSTGKGGIGPMDLLIVLALAAVVVAAFVLRRRAVSRRRRRRLERQRAFMEARRRRMVDVIESDAGRADSNVEVVAGRR